MTEKTLSQAEIDALIAKMAGGGGDDADESTEDDAST